MLNIDTNGLRAAEDTLLLKLVHTAAELHLELCAVFGHVDLVIRTGELGEVEAGVHVALETVVPTRPVGENFFMFFNDLPEPPPEILREPVVWVHLDVLDVLIIVLVSSTHNWYELKKIRRFSGWLRDLYFPNLDWLACRDVC